MEIKRVGDKLTADGKVVKCPECGSDHIWKVGPVPHRSGPKMRVKCADCALTFYPKAAKSTPRKRKLVDAVSLKPDEMFEEGEQE